MVCSTHRARQNDTKMKSQLHFPAEHWVAKVGRFGGTLEGRIPVVFMFCDLQTSFFNIFRQLKNQNVPHSVGKKLVTRALLYRIVERR